MEEDILQAALKGFFCSNLLKMWLIHFFKPQQNTWDYLGLNQQQKAHLERETNELVEKMPLWHPARNQNAIKGKGGTAEELGSVLGGTNSALA